MSYIYRNRTIELQFGKIQLELESWQSWPQIHYENQSAPKKTYQPSFDILRVAVRVFGHIW